MNVTFHQGFTKNLEELDGSLKGKAWDFVTKLSRDPDATGLDLKLPHAAQDRRIRTARVDRNYRAVLFLVGEGDARQLILAAIKPHDEAYAYAEHATMKVNATSGAVELRVVEAGHAATPAGDLPTDRPIAPPPPKVADQPQCLPFTLDELTALGIDVSVAQKAITLVDEGELLQLVEALPTWQESILLDLASGRSLAEVRSDYLITPVDAEHAETDQAIHEALARPTSQMEFAVATDDDELRRMLAGDFAKWRVFLHPTQRAIAYRTTFNGPFRLTGGAGTGKTVVALHRARYLASATPSTRVLLCTFNRTLAAQLKRDLLQLAGADVSERIDVLGIDQVARQIVTQAHGAAAPPLDDRGELDLWGSACAATGLDGDAVLTPGFLHDEYRYVIAALGLTSERAYLSAPRRGRGTRLDRPQRRRVWSTAEAFTAQLRQSQRTTFSQLVSDAVRALDAPEANAAIGRYSHVVVDEGQDLQPVHWRLLRALVPHGPNDLFLCEDGHQRLYGQRVVLSRLGIETRGRSRKLTLNYRTTRQILATAMAVLDGAIVQDLDGELDTTAGYRSASTGPQPILRGFDSGDAELAALIEQVTAWTTGPKPAGPGTIGVLLRKKQDATAVATAIARHGIKARLITADSRGGSEPVHVVTMHSAKGNEFQRVIAAHVDDHTLPSRYALSQAGADGEADALAREQFLLYVACSRARDELMITWTGVPSRFLKGLGQPGDR